MVQSLLAHLQRIRKKWGLGLLLMFLSLPVLLRAGPAPRDSKAHTVTVPVLLLDGGRKLVFEGSFSTEKDIQPKRGFFKKLLDIAVGAPEVHTMVRPFSVVTDSHGRMIVTDPGAGGVHIFDLKEQKYKFISRKDKTKEAMTTPQCVAVDAQDRIYVTDSELGKIFVFEPDGKFSRVIGSLKHGEGYFKHPTGIAVDSVAQRIYVSDTWRNEIFVMDLQGNVLQRIGKSGSGDGEFNFPTDLRLDGRNLIVLDAMNFRVQVLDLSGTFQYAIGELGEGQGEMFRPKGLGLDSEGHLYTAEGLSGVVQVFDRQGQLLYYFGKRGTGFGDFQLPTGLFIDREDHVYVVDSYNHRVQMFQYFAQGKRAAGGVQ
jgi:DNA-binding beta-propeller fold protein YncE